MSSSESNKWIAALRDPLLSVRINAAQYVGQCAPDIVEAIPLLRTMLDDPSAEARENAALALGAIGNYSLDDTTAGDDATNYPVSPIRPEIQSFFGRLIEMLEGDQSPSVRRAAASALGNLQTEASAAVPSLAESLRDADPELRAESARALGYVNHDLVTAGLALATALDDSSKKVQKRTSEAIETLLLGCLDRIGRTAEVVVAALTSAALANESSEVRSSARDTLGQVLTALGKCENLMSKWGAEIRRTPER